MQDRQVHSDEIRRNLRALLNAVEHKGEHVTILRYDTPAAVIVPVEWHEQARAAISGQVEQDETTAEGKT